MRFTLSTLFLVVAMVALACAGMMARTRWWADGIMALTVSLYAVVAIRAIGLKGSARVFAVTFSIVGSGYLLLTMCYFFSGISNVVPTNRVLCEVAKAAQIPKVLNNEFLTTQGIDKGGPPLDWDDVQVHYANDSSAGGVFLVIGHCVWSWLFALLGGWFAGATYAKQEELQTA